MRARSLILRLALLLAAGACDSALAARADTAASTAPAAPGASAASAPPASNASTSAASAPATSTASAGASAAAETAAPPSAAPADSPALPAAATAPGAARPGPVQLVPMTGPPGQLGGPSAGSLLQTILALLAVLGLLAGLTWVLKRYGPKAAGGSAHLRIVGGLNLGGRERIVVVEVAGQWIVVGASPGRVNALASMPRPEGAGIEATLLAQQAPAASFSEWLKQTIDKRNAK